MGKPAPDQLAANGKESYQAGNFLEAAQYFEESAVAYTSLSDPLNAAEMKNNSSVALLRAGKVEMALKACEQTDMVFAEAGDKKRQAFALGNQAAALEGLGQLKPALEKYQQSAGLLKEIDERENRSVVLQSISNLQMRMGDRLQAMATMQAALENKKKLTLKEHFLRKLLEIQFRFLNR